MIFINKKEKDYKLLSDEDLIPFILKEMNLFSHIIERYEVKLQKYIIRSFWIENPDDVLQDIFIKVYSNLNSFKTNLKFSSWIYRIAHNYTLDYLNKKKNEISFSDFSNNVNEEDDFFINKLDFLENIKSDENISTELNKKELISIIKQTIYSLPENYKDVLILKYYEDKDYDEISDILKIPNWTVATWLNRAKDQLKQDLIKNKILHFI